MYQALTNKVLLDMEKETALSSPFVPKNISHAGNTLIFLNTLISSFTYVVCAHPICFVTTYTKKGSQIILAIHLKKSTF